MSANKNNKRPMQLTPKCFASHQTSSFEIYDTENAPPPSSTSRKRVHHLDDEEEEPSSVPQQRKRQLDASLTPLKRIKTTRPSEEHTRSITTTHPHDNVVDDPYSEMNKLLRTLHFERRQARQDNDNDEL